MSICARVMVALSAGVVLGALALSAPAAAHTGVTAEPKVAGASNALLTVTAAAESTTAGVASLRVVLPAGIAAADVTYAGGPAGWALRPEPDGYTVAGPPLAAGRDVRHQVRVRQLPLVPTLTFKILQTYSDGRIDRWIELPGGGAEPEFPAPVVTLAPPAGGFPAPAPSSAAAASSPAPPPLGASPVPDQPSASPVPLVDDALPAPTGGDQRDGDGPGWVLWLGLALVVAAAAAGAAVLLRRRRRARG